MACLYWIRSSPDGKCAMIITYRTTAPGAMSIVSVTPGSNSPGLAPDPNFNTFTMADDFNVISHKDEYLVVESPPGSPVGVIRRNSVSMTAAPTGVYFNQASVISIQLKDSNNNNLPEVQTVVLVATAGKVPYSVTTSGLGAATFNYYPVKVGGDVVITGTVPAAATGFISGTVVVNVKQPVTSTQQNWLQTDDIQASAVTTPKIADGAVTVEKIQAGVVAPMMKSAAYATFDDYINTVVVDTTHIYVNGLSGGNGRIQKIDKATLQAVTGYSYANQAVSTGFDGMADDGTDIWLASGGDLVQLTKATWALNTFTIDATGGKLQFIVDDSTHILSFLRGGTSGDADKVVRINKGTGAVDASRDVHGDTGSTIIDHKYAAIFGTDLMLTAGAGTGNYIVVPKSLGSAASLSSALTPDVEYCIASDGKTIWAGGTGGIWFDETLAGYTQGTISVDASVIGTVYSLISDGTNMWAITSAPGGGNGRYLKELFRIQIPDPYGAGTLSPTIQIGRVIDLAGTYSLAIRPYDVTVNGSYLYTGNFQNQQGTNAKESVSIVQFKP